MNSSQVTVCVLLRLARRAACHSGELKNPGLKEMGKRKGKQREQRAYGHFGDDAELSTGVLTAAGKLEQGVGGRSREERAPPL